MIHKFAITAVFLCASILPALAEPTPGTDGANQPYIESIDTEQTKTTPIESNPPDIDEEMPELAVELGIPEKMKKNAAKPADAKPVKKNAPASKSIDKEVAQANRRSRLTKEALAFRGTPYVWGGGSRTGFDCSGFTQYLYEKRGIELPHSAKLQFKKGSSVAKDNLKEGDLVFFNTRGPLTHVGMYIGNGKFVHAANPRRGVTVDSLDSAYYAKCYAGARRYT